MVRSQRNNKYLLKSSISSSKVAISHKILNRFCKRAVVKYKLFKTFIPVTYAVDIRKCFVCSPALESKIY